MEIDSENSAKPIAKVLSAEDFIVVCQNLDALSKSEQGGIIWQKNEMKTKIEVYVRKQITEYVNSQKEDKKFDIEKGQKFLEFLMTVDKYLPW
jgi:hypothetical protein